MDTLTIELSLRDALPAAARGDQAAYGRVVALCQNAVTGIALAITVLAINMLGDGLRDAVDPRLSRQLR